MQLGPLPERCSRTAGVVRASHPRILGVALINWVVENLPGLFGAKASDATHGVR
jgi:hypothetical protein